MEQSYKVEVLCFDNNIIFCTVESFYVADDVNKLFDYVYQKYKHLQPDIKYYRVTKSSIQNQNLNWMLANLGITYSNQFN